MAGRGTDIQLGGNPDMRVRHELADVPEGPERDAQEREIRDRGRRSSRRRRSPPAASTSSAPSATRAGASTTSCAAAPAARATPATRSFFLSLQDDLMRIFGSERMDGMLQKLGLKEDEAIVHPWINQALEKAQQKVEARNFDIRKNLLKFDDVMNDQRKVIFEQRIELMGQETVTETVADMRHEVIDDLVAKHIPEKAYPEQWDVEGLQASRPADPQPRPADRGLGEGRRHRRRGGPRAHHARRRRGRRAARRRASAPRSCARSRRRCCCRRSTISGASIWSRSTICAR